MILYVFQLHLITVSFSSCYHGSFSEWKLSPSLTHFCSIPAFFFLKNAPAHQDCNFRITVISQPPGDQRAWGSLLSGSVCCLSQAALWHSAAISPDCFSALSSFLTHQDTSEHNWSSFCFFLPNTVMYLRDGVRDASSAAIPRSVISLHFSVAFTFLMLAPSHLFFKQTLLHEKTWILFHSLLIVLSKSQRKIHYNSEL